MRWLLQPTLPPASDERYPVASRLQGVRTVDRSADPATGLSQVIHVAFGIRVWIPDLPR